MLDCVKNRLTSFALQEFWGGESGTHLIKCLLKNAPNLIYLSTTRCESTLIKPLILHTHAPYIAYEICVSHGMVSFSTEGHTWISLLLSNEITEFTGRNENEFAVPTDYYSFNRKQIPKIFSEETILTGFAKPYPSYHNRMTINPNPLRSISHPCHLHPPSDGDENEI
jgi:hypothetical protein